MYVKRNYVTEMSKSARTCKSRANPLISVRRLLFTVRHPDGPPSLTVQELAAQILERGHVVTLAGEVSSQMAAAVLGNAGALRICRCPCRDR
jgi:hypothetical protein